MIISIGAEDALEKNSTLFMIRTLSNPGVERKFRNPIKDIYEEPSTNHILTMKH